MITRDKIRSQNRLFTVKGQKGNYALFSELSNTLKNVLRLKDSELNTSAINAITKSFTKLWNGATTNRHWRKESRTKENKGKLW